MSSSRSGNRSNLTRGQRLLWAGQQLHPETPLYNMAFSFEIAGAIDEEAFVDAFGRLVAESESLRTVIDVEGGEPWQRVIEKADFRLPVLDLSPTEYAQWSRERCESRLKLDRQTFDAALVRLGPKNYAWYLCQHHTVTDAWSMAVLYDRMRRLYEGRRRGAEVAAATLSPYSDYVEFERGQPPDRTAEQHWSRYRLRPDPAPTLYGRRSVRGSTANERVSCLLGVERSQRLRRLAARPEIRAFTADLSLFRLMLTAVFAYLHRVSGQNAITLGAPAHNRVAQRFRQTDGLFTEIFPLGVAMDADETLASLHGKVCEETDAFLRAVRPGDGDAAMNRGASVVVNYLRAEFGPIDGLPVETRWLHPGHVDAQHQLRLQVHDFHGSGELTLDFDMSCDVFDERLRGAAPKHFVRVLDAMLADWDGRVDAVDLLAAAERTEVQRLCHGAETGSLADVVAAFEARVAETPDAVAVNWGGQSWSYQELDRRASAIASGLEPGSVVGLAVRRSAAAVAAILGVLKAGAAYVPIDPSWPRGRSEFVARDAGCSAVLDDAAVDDLLKRDISCSAGQTVPGDRLAYILYTSGSTGRPKGVTIERGALASYVNWAAKHYSAGRRLTFPLFSPLAFDLTVTSIFVPLVSGGSIVVYPESGDDADLAVLNVFAENRVDIVKLTPSHLAALQEQGLSGSRVRQLILGGEELTTALARRIRERLSEVRIHNEYGPTEATVGCIVHEYDPERDHDAAVPIGRPIAGVRAYVLDQQGRPLPFGVAGDLWIGGPGLARGYANLPELTRERFAANDHLGEARLYRTGDRARLRPDGVFEYLGRVDDQVKIRGARVELGEIEAVLATHPGVTAAATALVTRAVESASAGEDRVYCSRCGLSSEFPGVSFDAERVCNHCRAFERYGDKSRVYFKSMAELEAVFRERPSAGRYDCIALLSGGKDSTYMLCRLVDMGLRVLAFTLDNGFLSEQAKANIRRVCRTLGVEHVFGSTPAMNEIFVDSLERHANVCNGCFKTIYTLSLKLAREKGIPQIVTGLSRGQFFETRLTEDLFTNLTVSVEQIDANTLEARKAYHRIDDAVNRRLDVSIFDDDTIFSEVRFVDFYRYCDVELDEMLAYLDRRVPWVRPTDTGRSTNCLINDVGIYVHRRKLGFHNYALPYSWDVRMGHKTREAALAELDDEIDPGEVQRILDQIGFPEDITAMEGRTRLVGYYTGPSEIEPGELRRYLSERLPAVMIPARFMRLEELPLTANGKVDRSALPDPEVGRPAVNTAFQEPSSDTEQTLAHIWAEALGVERVGVRDDFLELGGDSIGAIQIVARARRAGLTFTLAEFLEALTIERLASVCRDASVSAERVSGPQALTPAQQWFFEEQPNPRRLLHLVKIAPRDPIDAERLLSALTALTDHHEALRQRFYQEDGAWRSVVEERAPVLDLQLLDSDDELRREFDLSQPPLLRAALIDSELVLAAHHLITDAVSWSILIDDLAHLYEQLERSEAPRLPPAGTSLKRWTESLVEDLDRVAVRERAVWLSEVRGGSSPSRPAGGIESLHTRVPDEQSETLLREAPGWRVGVDEFLAAALVRAWRDWSGEQDVRLVLESHGRESSDPSQDVTRTVGWFTSLYPVTFRGPDDASPGALVRDVKERLRRIAHGGRGYGVLRYLDPVRDRREELRFDAGERVLFNYLGRLDRAGERSQAFALAAPIELDRGPGARLPFFLEANAAVVNGTIGVEWTFDRARLDRAAIEALSRCFLDSFQVLMKACARPETETVSAADFPLANLNQAGLGKLAALLGSKDGG